MLSKSTRIVAPFCIALATLSSRAFGVIVLKEISPKYVAEHKDQFAVATAMHNGSNAATTTFPQCSGGTSTVTHFGVGTAASGAGVLLFSGALTASLAISNGITPQFAIGDLDIDVQ